MSRGSGWLAQRRALLIGAGGALDAVASALEANGAQVAHGSVLADAPAIGARFDEAQGPSGMIDVLVHFCGPPNLDPGQEGGLPAWRAAFSDDLDSAFFHAAEMARRCVASQRSGAILFLLPSPAARPTEPGVAALAGALENLVKTLAVEWARDGIRVNAIVSRVCDPAQTLRTSEAASLGNLAAYLLSDYAAYVSGTVCGVNDL